VINELCKGHASNSRLGVAYFYCNGGYSQTQDPRIILGSLCRQLLLQSLSLDHGWYRVPALNSLYRDHKLGRVTKNQILSSIRERIIDFSFVFQSIDIVIDGLDELNSLTYINELLQSAMAKQPFRILVASRPIPSVENAFQHINNVFRIEMNEIIVSADIGTYIDSRLENDVKFRSVKEEMKTMIREELLNKSNGM
jgi:hypothetical protein